MIRIINADVIDGLRSLPEKSVHCVITSPPYWGLRDYGVEGQIGLEKTPEEYLEKMVQVFREVKRVLRDDGTLWLNIGDSYANAQPRGRMEDQGDLSTGDHGELIPKRDWSCWNLKQKDLVGMCWRVAFALQSEGWYLRSDIIWAKPNPMPESITDRPIRSHEYVFLLAKSARYFYDADAVREAHKEPWRGNGEHERINFNTGGIIGRGRVGEYEDGIRQYNPAGRNRRDVWTITTQPTPEAHFACVDDATEALTTSGWKGIYSLHDGEKIAAFDGVALSWQEATFHEYHYSGKMVVISSRDLSMYLTPNHRVVCRDYRGKGEWKIKRADALLGREEIPTAARFDCDTYGSLINTEVAELAGWILTDGGYNPGKTITLYQTGGRGKHERIEYILGKLNIEYKLYQRDRGHGDERAYSFKGPVADFMREVFPGKRGNYGILATWNEDDLRSLWVGMTEGDGHLRPDGRINFIGNLEKVNFYQALSIRLGMTCRKSARHGDSYSAFVSKKTNTSLRGTNGMHKSITSASYDGIVWCPSIKSGMWLARRNGRPFITGNTFPEALVEPCIKAGTSERGCCSVCGAPWIRVVERERIWTEKDRGTTNKDHHLQPQSAARSGNARMGNVETNTLGWQPTCLCGNTNLKDPEVIPCTVLDPFGGSGTVAKVARDLNRDAILIEINPAYVEIARRKLRADEQLFENVKVITA